MRSPCSRSLVLASLVVLLLAPVATAYEPGDLVREVDAGVDAGLDPATAFFQALAAAPDFSYDEAQVETDAMRAAIEAAGYTVPA